MKEEEIRVQQNRSEDRLEVVERSAAHQIAKHFLGVAG